MFFPNPSDPPVMDETERTGGGSQDQIEKMTRIWLESKGEVRFCSPVEPSR